MYKAPLNYPCHGRARAVLELRGNPFPPLIPDQSKNRNLIHNVLLDAAKKEFREAKYAEIAAKLAPQGSNPELEALVENNAAKKEIREAKYAEIAAKLETQISNGTSDTAVESNTANVGETNAKKE